MKLSSEDTLNELLREGFVYFAAAQHHVHTYKNLANASLDFDAGYGIGMFRALEQWMQEHVLLFPLGFYHQDDPYDLYVGEDQQLYAVDSVHYWCVSKVGQHVRDGLEGIVAGQFNEKKELVLAVRRPQS